MKAYLCILALAVSLFSTACGGGGMTKTTTTPPPVTYTIGGSLSGLVGTGLMLQNNSGDTLPVSATATGFTFKTAINSGSTYKVSVMTQPSSPTQNCVVTNASGTATGNVSSVKIACTTTTYTIGGSISGLAGTGLVLQDNSGDNLSVTAAATSFTFATAINSGAGYNVSVHTQPSSPAQNCVVSNNSGNATGNITTVSVACTTITYTIGGTISGLTGTGLKLQNGAEILTVLPSATSFAFVTPVNSGGGYNVSLLAQPSSPVESCVVNAGSGNATANVTSVSVVCSSTYTVGGTISGLGGQGLVLQDNGGDSLSLAANQTTFKFATALADGTAYHVTVFGQPNIPAQSCAVSSGGSGSSTVDITNVFITCSNVNEWTWESGPTLVNQFGSYGSSVGTTGTPGARYSGLSWSDASGNFWLFGGLGFGSSGQAADLNDLWEGSYNSSNQWTWTWVGGKDVAGAGGDYGTLGTADPANFPGARDAAVSWTDASGNFWLFGGHGYDSAKTADNLNDLWMYSPSSGEWTWESGVDTVDQLGVYGTKGTGSTSNVPGARYSAVSWIDKNGNFWLFGGRYDTAGPTANYLNDLWEYNPTTSKWTWQSGSNAVGAEGTYGNLGQGSASTTPGARYLSTSWTDSQGHLWLFGGYGPDSAGNTAVLNDLWEYNTSSGQWTWMGGSNLADVKGVYGTLATADPANIPGSRKGAVAWTDVNGNFWVFGGVGVDSTGVSGELNDLWEYNPVTSEWTWQSGSNLIDGLGSYGTLGLADPTNLPGARGVSATWTDASGNLWLFGGNGPSSGANGSFSDLWKFVP
jgi:N-acetylneuraminic acid mutarotase